MVVLMSYGVYTFMIATFTKFQGNKVSTICYLLPSKSSFHFVTYTNLALVQTRNKKHFCQIQVLGNLYVPYQVLCGNFTNLVRGRFGLIKNVPNQIEFTPFYIFYDFFNQVEPPKNKLSPSFTSYYHPECAHHTSPLNLSCYNVDITNLYSPI